MTDSYTSPYGRSIDTFTCYGCRKSFAATEELFRSGRCLACRRAVTSYTTPPSPAVTTEVGAAKAEKPTTFVKHDAGKSRVELIPPAVLLELGHVLRIGAEKYDADNWKRGAAWRRYIGAALRHVYAFASGEPKDPESGRSHLIHAICCLVFLFEYERLGLGTDDRA